MTGERGAFSPAEQHRTEVARVTAWAERRAVGGDVRSPPTTAKSVTPRLVDLNDIAGLERAWAELEAVRAVRAIDPELRANIERRLDRLDPDVAEPLRTDLDRIHPDAFLAAHFETLVPRGPLP